MPECKRCGTCCINGGPALHKADLPLITEHRLTLTDLITIRSGEPVISPLTNSVEPARVELIKLAGRNDTWTCHFFDQEQNGCGIYAHRPLECRLLKCWEPSALTSVIYQDSLSRKDVVVDDEELWELIELQEEHCSYATLSQQTKERAEGNDPTMLTEIARIINLDLKIRQLAIQRRQLSLAEELLYFGRPMFKSLDFYHLAIKEGPLGLTVTPASSFGTER